MSEAKITKKLVKAVTIRFTIWSTLFSGFESHQQQKLGNFGKCIKNFQNLAKILRNTKKVSMNKNSQPFRLRNLPICPTHQLCQIQNFNVNRSQYCGKILHRYAAIMVDQSLLPAELCFLIILDDAEFSGADQELLAISPFSSHFDQNSQISKKLLKVEK